MDGMKTVEQREMGERQQVMKARGNFCGLLLVCEVTEKGAVSDALKS